MTSGPGWTLHLGDCREVVRTLPDNSVDMVFTDPPYGHNNNDGSDLIGRVGLFRGKEYEQGAKSDGRPIANDGVEANDLYRELLPELRRVLKPGCCCCCCCGGGGPDPQFARWSLWMNEVFEFKQMVVWDKGPMGMGWHYRRSYETVLVGMKKGAACKWYDDSDRVENIIRHIGKIIPGKDDHPTPKPVALAKHFIALHSQPGDVVLDPFAGGGTTLMAAASMGRKAIGVEIDQRWAAMAEGRLRNVTPCLFGGAA